MCVFPPLPGNYTAITDKCLATVKADSSISGCALALYNVAHERIHSTDVHDRCVHSLSMKYSVYVHMYLYSERIDKKKGVGECVCVCTYNAIFHLVTKYVYWKGCMV